MQAPVADDSTRNRVWTLPNLLSGLRLAGVPVFLWLVLGPEADGWALGLLVLSGITDYLDGWLARRWDQVSVLGQILDPVADRLYILAVVIGLAMRDVIPWWVAISLPLRDLLMWGLVPLLRTRGYSALPVHFLGKAATFNLLYAFPLLLLGDGDGVVPDPGPGLRVGLRRVGDRASTGGPDSSTPGRSAACSRPPSLDVGRCPMAEHRHARTPAAARAGHAAPAVPDHPAVARRGLPPRRRAARSRRTPPPRPVDSGVRRRS